MTTALRAAIVPGSILIVTAIAVAAGPGLPPGLAGLTILGPYLALLAAAALALLFNRGRVFLVAPQVENSGIIRAPQGEIVLAAGRSADLVSESSPYVSVPVASTVPEIRLVPVSA